MQYVERLYTIGPHGWQNGRLMHLHVEASIFQTYPFNLKTSIYLRGIIQLSTTPQNCLKYIATLPLFPSFFCGLREYCSAWNQKWWSWKQYHICLLANARLSPMPWSQESHSILFLCVKGGGFHLRSLDAILLSSHFYRFLMFNFGKIIPGYHSLGPHLITPPHPWSLWFWNTCWLTVNMILHRAHSSISLVKTILVHLSALLPHQSFQFS